MAHTALTRRTAACGILLALAACGHKSGLIPVVPPTATLERYARIIDEQAAIDRVPPALIGAIIVVESGGNPRATSPSGSVGLMQIKRATAARYGVSDLYDPVANITAGARYLRDLLARFRRNVTLAVAAYHAGPAAVSAAEGVPASSTGYVQRVLGAYDALLHAGETSL
jgi:soluble lytic murein transglycosylase-like protein